MRRFLTYTIIYLLHLRSANCFPQSSNREYWTNKKWGSSLPMFKEQTGSKRTVKKQQVNHIKIDTSKLYNELLTAFSTDKVNRRGHVPDTRKKTIQAKNNKMPFEKMNLNNIKKHPQQRHFVNPPSRQSPTMAAYDPFWANQAWIRDSQPAISAPVPIPQVSHLPSASSQTAASTGAAAPPEPSPPAPPPAKSSKSHPPQLYSQTAKPGALESNRDNFFKDFDVQSYDAEVIPDGKGGMQIVNAAKQEKKSSKTVQEKSDHPNVASVVNNPRNTPVKSEPVPEKKASDAAKRVYSLGDHIFTDVGCYLDKWIRAIPTLEGNHALLMDSDYKSRSDPLQKCAEAALDKGLKMFALQNGGQCFGGKGGETRYKIYGPSSDCREDGLGGGWASEVYTFNGDPPNRAESLYPDKHPAAASKDEMPGSESKEKVDDYDKSLLKEEQELSESEEKSSSSEPMFKGVLGKIMNKVKEKDEKVKVEKVEKDSLKAVKELLKGVKGNNDASNKPVVKDDAMAKDEIKDEQKNPYSLGAAVAKGHKPPCICPDKICSSKLDLAFVVDASAGSEQSGKDKMAETMEFGRRVSSAFKVAPDESRVGLVTYATDAQIMMNFHRFSDPEALIEARDALRVKPHTGKYTGEALTLAKEGLFDIGHRSEALDVLILLTDGASSDDIVEPSRKLRDMGVKIITVGIGSQVDKAQLKDIASDPDEEHVFQADYDNLASIIRRTQKAACVGGVLRDPASPCKCEKEHNEPDSETAAFWKIYRASVEAPTTSVDAQAETRYDTIPKPFKTLKAKVTAVSDEKTGVIRELPLGNPRPPFSNRSPLIALAFTNPTSSKDDVHESLRKNQKFAHDDKHAVESDGGKAELPFEQQSVSKTNGNHHSESVTSTEEKASKEQLEENERLVVQYIEHYKNVRDHAKEEEDFDSKRKSQDSGENTEKNTDEKVVESKELLDDQFPSNTEGKIHKGEEENILGSHKPNRQAGGAHQLPLETMQREEDSSRFSNDNSEQSHHQVDHDESIDSTSKHEDHSDAKYYSSEESSNNKQYSGKPGSLDVKTEREKEEYERNEAKEAKETTSYNKKGDSEVKDVDKFDGKQKSSEGNKDDRSEKDTSLPSKTNNDQFNKKENNKEDEKNEEDDGKGEKNYKEHDKSDSNDHQNKHAFDTERDSMSDGVKDMKESHHEKEDPTGKVDEVKMVREKNNQQYSALHQPEEGRLSEQLSAEERKQQRDIQKSLVNTDERLLPLHKKTSSNLMEPGGEHEDNSERERANFFKELDDSLHSRSEKSSHEYNKQNESSELEATKHGEEDQAGSDGVSNGHHKLRAREHEDSGVDTSSVQDEKIISNNYDEHKPSTNSKPSSYKEHYDSSSSDKVNDNGENADTTTNGKSSEDSQNDRSSAYNEHHISSNEKPNNDYGEQYHSKSEKSSHNDEHKNSRPDNTSYVSKIVPSNVESNSFDVNKESSHDKSSGYIDFTNNKERLDVSENHEEDEKYKDFHQKETTHAAYTMPTTDDKESTSATSDFKSGAEMFKKKEDDREHTSNTHSNYDSTNENEAPKEHLHHHTGEFDNKEFREHPAPEMQLSTEGSSSQPLHIDQEKQQASHEHVGNKPLTKTVENHVSFSDGANYKSRDTEDMRHNREDKVDTSSDRNDMQHEPISHEKDDDVTFHRLSEGNHNDAKQQQATAPVSQGEELHDGGKEVSLKNNGEGENGNFAPEPNENDLSVNVQKDATRILQNHDMQARFNTDNERLTEDGKNSMQQAQEHDSRVSPDQAKDFSSLQFEKEMFDKEAPHKAHDEEKNHSYSSHEYSSEQERKENYHEREKETGNPQETSEHSRHNVSVTEDNEPITDSEELYKAGYNNREEKLSFFKNQEENENPIQNLYYRHMKERLEEKHMNEKIESTAQQEATKKDSTDSKGILTEDPFLDATHFYPFELSHSILSTDVVTGHNAILLNSTETKNKNFCSSLSTEKKGSYAIAGDFKGTCFSDPSKCIMGGMTVSFWVKLDESKIDSSQDAYILSSGGQSKKSRGFAFLYFHGKYVVCFSTEKKHWKMTIDKIPQKKFINIAFVWKMNGALTYYLDGALKQSEEGTSTSRKSDDYTILTISRPNNAVNAEFMFPLRMSSLALWDRPLKAKQINRIYSNIKTICSNPILEKKRSRVLRARILHQDQEHLLENEKRR